MKYTKCVDGRERANVRVTVRLTREEFAAMSDKARLVGSKNLRDWMYDYLMTGLWLSLDEDASYELEYSRKESEVNNEKIREKHGVC